MTTKSRIAYVFLFLLLGLVRAKAELPCALKITIDRGGGVAPLTSVELRDEKGEIVDSQTVGKATVSICDFGLGRHTLRVGRNECYPTVIENLFLIPDHTLELTIKMNDCLPHTSRNFCTVYFRISEHKRPAVNAVVYNTDGYQAGVTDRYGRFYTRLLIGKQEEFKIYTDGVLRKRELTFCQGLENHWKEISLTE